MPINEQLIQFGGYPLWTDENGKPFCQYAVLRDGTDGQPIEVKGKMYRQVGSEKTCNRGNHQDPHTGKFNMRCRGGRLCPKWAFTGKPCPMEDVTLCKGSQ